MNNHYILEMMEKDVFGYTMRNANINTITDVVQKMKSQSAKKIAKEIMFKCLLKRNYKGCIFNEKEYPKMDDISLGVVKINL